MQITADINTDDIAQEVIESADFDRAINDAVDSLVNDQVAEHLERLDIDDIADFASRAEEIARDVVSEILDDEINGRVRDAVEQAMVDAPDPQDADDRITDLENKVDALTDTVERLVDALSAAALLLGVVAKG